MTSSSTGPVEGGGEGHQAMVVDNDEDLMFLDIVSSASASAGGRGHEAPAAAVNEDEGDLLQLEVRVCLMDRQVSMEISLTPNGEDLNGDDDDDDDSPTDNVDPPVLDYKCSYPTCYWRFPSYARTMDHITNFHLHDEETAPIEWYQIELDPSIGSGFFSASEELDLVQEVLANQDGFDLDIYL